MRDFSHTLNVLVKAYLNDTLEHHDCRACAVTNIIGHDGWNRLFITLQSPDGSTIEQFKAKKGSALMPGFIGARVVPINEVSFRVRTHMEEGMKAIEASGYTVDELAKIEYAFESCPKGNNEDEHMFNGLCAVVDVLADIHNIDLHQREESKALFVKA
jgi:hypothetical protein